MLILDFILILLTLACIVYCWILNKRILQIQQFRAELMQMFKEFDKSVVAAEKTLASTKQFTEQAEAQLHSLEVKTNTLTEELRAEITQANQLAAELELIITSGKKLTVKLAAIEENLNINVENSEQLQEELNPAAGGVPYMRPSEPQMLSQQDYYEMLQKKRLKKNEN